MVEIKCICTQTLIDIEHVIHHPHHGAWSLSSLTTIMRCRTPTMTCNSALLCQFNRKSQQQLKKKKIKESITAHFSCNLCLVAHTLAKVDLHEIVPPPFPCFPITTFYFLLSTWNIDSHFITSFHFSFYAQLYGHFISNDFPLTFHSFSFFHMEWNGFFMLLIYCHFCRTRRRVIMATELLQIETPELRFVVRRHVAVVSEKGMKLHRKVGGLHALY